MEDLRSSKFDSARANKQRSEQPLGQPLPPPKKVGDWIKRVQESKDPAVTPLDIDWETGPALRILASLETHAQEEVKSLVKKRSTFSSSDKSDNAPTLFRVDLFGERADLGSELRNLRAAHAGDSDADADGANRRQLGKTSTWISSSSGAGKDITELGRPALEMHCGLSQADVTTHGKLVRLYDIALCCWLCPCCEPNMARLLDAERITAVTAPSGEHKWEDHKATLLAQLRNTSESDDVLTFFLKARDENLHIRLWVAERRSERALLEKDGVQMGEKMWLSHTTHFIPQSERVILKLPAEKDFEVCDRNRGHKMPHLESAVSTSDPLSFTRFRHNAVHSPLAKRLLTMHRAMNKGASSSVSGQNKNGSRNKNESFSANQDQEKSAKNTRNRKQTSKSTGSSSQSKKGHSDEKCQNPDDISVLPSKGGNLDTGGTRSGLKAPCGGIHGTVSWRNNV
jgi:hypothetical protein